MHEVLASAPADLAHAYTNKTAANGFKRLEVLVTRPDMRHAWRELAKRATRPDHGMRLFQEILSILMRLKKPVTLRRSEERDEYMKIARLAEKLAKSITGGPLDLLAYEYFPENVMAVFGMDGWSRLNAESRAGHGHALLSHWPSLPEMLDELARRAREAGNQAIRSSRLVDQQSGPQQYRLLYFVRALSRYINREYGSPLYGTVARITNAVWGSELTKEQVAKMTRGSP